MKSFLYVLACMAVLSLSSCGDEPEPEYIQFEQEPPHLVSITTETPSMQNTETENETVAPQKIADAVVNPSQEETEVTVYYGKSESSPEFAKVEKGQTVEVYEQGDEWCRIMLESKLVYIKSDCLEFESVSTE